MSFVLKTLFTGGDLVEKIIAYQLADARIFFTVFFLVFAYNWNIISCLWLYQSSFLLYWRRDEAFYQLITICSKLLKVIWLIVKRSCIFFKFPFFLSAAIHSHKPVKITYKALELHTDSYNCHLSNWGINHILHHTCLNLIFALTNIWSSQLCKITLLLFRPQSGELKALHIWRRKAAFQNLRRGRWKDSCIQGSTIDNAN